MLHGVGGAVIITAFHLYCAVLLHSCILLPPVGHSANHQYRSCQLEGNRAAFRIFIALLKFFIRLSLVYVMKLRTKHTTRSSNNKHKDTRK